MKNLLSTTDLTKRASKILGLDDTKRLGIALTAAAVEELDANSAFASRVRALYGILPTAATKSSGGKKSAPKALTVELEPVKHVEGFTLNPATPLDPYLVYEAYGAKQLPTALDLFPIPKLKQAAALVEERNPGTKPTNRGQKGSLIEYIVRYVAEE